MGSALQEFQAAQAAKLVKPPVSAQQPTSPVEKVQAVLATGKTYVHQVAGANTILPDGKKLIFGGKTGRAIPGGGWLHGGFGYYTTDLPEEIEWLEALCKAPTSQITRLIEDKVSHTEVIEKKRVDPAIKQSTEDAAANSQRAMDPAISAAQEGLSKTIALDNSRNG